MKKYKLLDLFCGVGGCSMGYYNAGFEVEGVDIAEQVDYPFKFYQHDALDFKIDLNKYDVIHASPPCQAYSCATAVTRKNGKKYPDLVKLTRDKLVKTGKIYVIENVPGSPLIEPIQLCASSFHLYNNKLKITRHRWFESNVKIFGLPCQHSKFKINVSIAGNGLPKEQWVKIHRCLKINEKQHLMNINWTKSKYSINQAIPPDYTEFIGKQLIAILNSKPLQSLKQKFENLYK